MTWRRRSDPPDADDWQPITSEDVAWRIGASDARPAPPPRPDGAIANRAEESTAAAAAATAASRTTATHRTTVADRHRPHAHPVIPGTTRRVLIWRDASAILFVLVVLVFVAAQLTLPDEGPLTAAGPTSSVAALPTQDALGATGTPIAAAAAPTIGPVVDPSLIPNIEATPTPVPTPRPTATPRPTPRPTPRATPLPPPTAPPTPSPTPAPPVIASVTCAPDSGSGSVTSTCTATGANVASWTWTVGGTQIGTGASVVHTFTTGLWEVVVTASGPGGTDTGSDFVDVQP